MKLASVLDQPWATHFLLQLRPSTRDHFPYVDKYKVISKRNLYWPIFHPFAWLSALIRVIYYTFNKKASKHQKHKRPSLALWELMDLVSLIFGKLIGEISKRLKRIIVISRIFKVLAANSSGVLNFSKIYSGSIFDINMKASWRSVKTTVSKMNLFSRRDRSSVENTKIKPESFEYFFHFNETYRKIIKTLRFVSK